MEDTLVDRNEGKCVNKQERNESIQRAITRENAEKASQGRPESPDLPRQHNVPLSESTESF